MRRNDCPRWAGIRREEELDRLARRWELAERGVGRVVLLIGEAGIGKSRLVRALAGAVAWGVICVADPSLLAPPKGHRLLSDFGRASSSRRHRARRRRKDQARQARSVAPAVEREPREGRAAVWRSPLHYRWGALFAAEADATAIEGAYPGRPASSHQATLHRGAGADDRRGSPNWIDPTSLEALSRIIEEASGLRLLLLMTARPEFTPPWPNHRHTATMALTRLGRSEIEALVAGMSHGRPLPLEVFEQIADRTDGVPLFIEELTKSVLESGLLWEVGDRYELRGPLPALAIPSTLHASLLARLDRLGVAKDVAQVAAVIGREFSYGLILAVTGLAEKELKAALARRESRPSWSFSGAAPPEATYIFKHALLQDAAYGSVLRTRRQQVHAAIRGALEDRFPEAVEAQPELLAFHCGEAGLIREAIDYWERAGRHGADRSANREATGHFRRALKLIERTPESPERDERELNLVIALGPALLATRPSADAEVARTYARAGELAREDGALQGTVSKPLGAHLVAVVGGDNATAAKLVDELFAIARGLGDPDFLLQAHHAAFGVRRTAGVLADAQQHAEAALDLYRPDLHGRQALIYGAHDPGACAHMNLALLLLLRGFPDQSQAQAERGLVLARSLQHRQTLLQTLRMAAELHCLRREPRATAELTAELLRLERPARLGRRHCEWHSAWRLGPHHAGRAGGWVERRAGGSTPLAPDGIEIARPPTIGCCRGVLHRGRRARNGPAALGGSLCRRGAWRALFRV